LWYRGFLYERDRESRLECVEDLYHPGTLELPLVPGKPCSLVLSSPSPRSASEVDGYVARERQRREALTVENPAGDGFFTAMRRSADHFIYERFDDTIGVHPGLPWGECEWYRGLQGFVGLFLVPRRHEMARQYLLAAAHRWMAVRRPTGFCPQTAWGQMHAADAPLWLILAAWQYWKATGDIEFVRDVLYPALNDIDDCYMWGEGEVRNHGGLIEVGYESGADYAPILPLGTNCLWCNAKLVMADFERQDNPTRAGHFVDMGRQAMDLINRMFSCQGRAGLADGVVLEPSFWRDETIRCSQILAVGLPFCVSDNIMPVVRIIKEHLATPLGPRTLSPKDSRYVGDGSDVRILPKQWSGSVDPAWFGLYCDALRRGGGFRPGKAFFAGFEAEIDQRGMGHISGAFTGDAPHTACDYVASAGASGELMRIYARDVLQFH